MTKQLSAALLVGLGGSVGALLRYGITLWVQPLFASFPASTLLINLGGCLVIGGIAGMADASIAVHPAVRLFLVTGFCGAFTTMSAFVCETDQLARNGEPGRAMVYFAATLAGSFALFFAAFYGTRSCLK